MHILNNTSNNINSIGLKMVDPSSFIQALTGLVIFEKFMKEFCIDIKDVTAIINPNDIPDIAIKFDQENYSLNLNENEISIVKLSNDDRFDTGEFTKDSRILMVEHENKKFGFLVDKITEIITVDIEFKSEAIKYIPMDKDPNLLGIINYEGRVLNLPAYSKLLSSANI